MLLVRIRPQSSGRFFSEVRTRTGLPSDQVFWVAALCAAISILAGASLAPGLVSLGEALGPESPVLSRLVITMPALGVPLGAFLASRFLRLDQHQTTLIAAIYLFAGAGCLAAALRSYEPILALRLLQGVSVGAIMVIAMGLLARGPDARGRMGLQSTVMTASTLLILVAGGVASAMMWWLPMVLSALPLLLLGAIRRLPQSVFDAPASAPVPQDMHNNDQAGAFTPILILAFFAMTAFYAIPTQIPASLDALGYSSALSAAGMIMVSVLGAAAGGIVFRRTKDAVSDFAILSAAFVLLILGFVYLAYSAGWPPVVLGTAMIGLGFGMIFPALNFWASTKALGRTIPVAMASVTTAFQLGQFFSPVAGSPALSPLVPTQVYLPYAAVSVFALALLCVCRSKFAADARSTDETSPLVETKPMKAA